ncbi:MAG TPA: Ig-like domain-containing protein [Desulfuromonadales bacterium]|nr:Ig-like domain-containing protein [Desulfuromonadales bacterium]
MKSKLLLASGFLGSLLLIACFAGCGGSSGGTENVIDNDESTPQIGVGPKVLSTSPSHDEIDVKINRLITAKFEQAIDPATMSSETFLIREDETGLTVPGTVDYDEPSKTAIFQGDTDFSTNTSYTATITEDVADEAGNQMGKDYSWQFETGVDRDTTSPQVAFTYPERNATDVSLNTAISVTFDEHINPITINNLNFTLEEVGGIVSGALTLNGTTALFTPDENLLDNTEYTVTLTSDIEDLAGNSFSGDSWSFTTGSGQDTEPPQVEPDSVSPQDGATDVPLDASIVITYSEPIKPFEFGLIDGRPVTVTFNKDYTIATLTPTVPFLPGKLYTASVRSEDLAGNRMDEAFIWEFSTIDQ